MGINVGNKHKCHFCIKGYHNQSVVSFCWFGNRKGINCNVKFPTTLFHCHFCSTCLTWSNSWKTVWHKSDSKHIFNFFGIEMAYLCLLQIINKKAQLSLTNPRDAKSLPKIASNPRAYNVVADNTGLSSFV